MEDLFSKVKSKRSPLERIMSYIPLYHGYKEKELRRESDRILRVHIYQILSDAKQAIKKTQIKLVKNKQTEIAKSMDELITKCDTISQKINRAEGGYSGFWDATKIKETELERLYQIDAALASTAEKVKQEVKVMLEKSSEQSFAINDDIIQSIESFDEQMTSRTELLRGFS